MRPIRTAWRGSSWPSPPWSWRSRCRVCSPWCNASPWPSAPRRASTPALSDARPERIEDGGEGGSSRLVLPEDDAPLMDEPGNQTQGDEAFRLGVAPHGEPRPHGESEPRAHQLLDRFGVPQLHGLTGG